MHHWWFATGSNTQTAKKTSSSFWVWGCTYGGDHNNHKGDFFGLYHNTMYFCKVTLILSVSIKCGCQFRLISFKVRKKTLFFSTKYDSVTYISCICQFEHFTEASVSCLHPKKCTSAFCVIVFTHFAVIYLDRCVILRNFMTFNVIQDEKVCCAVLKQ